MAARHTRDLIDGTAATPFAAAGTADRIARLLVLDMVLWPGLLFTGVSLLALWQLRTSPAALAVFLVATLFSVVVGIRQWHVMLRSVFPARRDQASARNAVSLDTKEASPRLTGRGTTGR
jgi:hypothetical protein